MQCSRLSSGWERSCAGKAFDNKFGGAQTATEEEFDSVLTFPPLAAQLYPMLIGWP